MVIKDKWVVIDIRSNTYFAGLKDNDYPILERLSGRTRTYNSERSAKMAINRIGGREYCEFSAQHIDYKELPDEPIEPKLQDKPVGVLLEQSAAISGLVIVKDRSGWVPVFAGASPPSIAHSDARFADITLYCKRVGDREMFGVLARDGELYSAGFGGGEVALDFFLREYRDYLLPRVSRT